MSLEDANTDETPREYQKTATGVLMLTALGKKDAAYSAVLQAKDEDREEAGKQMMQLMTLVIKLLAGMLLTCILMLGVIAGAVAGGKLQLAGNEIELGPAK